MLCQALSEDLETRHARLKRCLTSLRESLKLRRSELGSARSEAGAEIVLRSDFISFHLFSIDLIKLRSRFGAFFAVFSTCFSREVVAVQQRCWQLQLRCEAEALMCGTEWPSTRCESRLQSAAEAKRGPCRPFSIIFLLEFTLNLAGRGDDLSRQFGLHQAFRDCSSPFLLQEW